MFLSPSLLHTSADQKVNIPAFDIQSLLPKDLRRYYRYNGSLTTPPCHQSVTWTLFHERVQISKDQVKHIRNAPFLAINNAFTRWTNLPLFPQLLKMETTLFSSKTEDADTMLLQDNYRSTQPLNHRIILTSFSAGKTDSVKKTTN